MQLGMTEMIFIFLLALVIFGPKKLPEIGRQLGKAMNEFKRASNEFRSQLEDEIRQIDVAEQAKKLAAPAESAEPVIAPPRDAIAQGALPSDTWFSPVESMLEKLIKPTAQQAGMTLRKRTRLRMNTNVHE